MIPDKIYVGVGTLSSIQPAEEYAFPGWQEKPYSQIRNEEYIRKDALINFLEKEKFDLYNWHFQDEDRKFKVYEEVINKIKEL